MNKAQGEMSRRLISKKIKKEGPRKHRKGVEGERIKNVQALSKVQ